MSPSQVCFYLYFYFSKIINALKNFVKIYSPIVARFAKRSSEIRVFANTFLYRIIHEVRRRRTIQSINNEILWNARRRLAGVEVQPAKGG